MRYKGAYRPSSILGVSSHRAWLPAVLTHEQIRKVLNGVALMTNTGRSSIAILMSPCLEKKGLQMKPFLGRGKIQPKTYRKWQSCRKAEDRRAQPHPQIRVFLPLRVLLTTRTTSLTPNPRTKISKHHKGPCSTTRFLASSRQKMWRS